MGLWLSPAAYWRLAWQLERARGIRLCEGGIMRKLRLLDLFSGIGGFSLGLERSGAFETVAFCEIEDFPRRVLAKHWPEVPCYDDVRTLTASKLAADGIAVDAICGGFPCQDLSVAGRGAGIDGERSGLWSEIIRLSCEIRPRIIIVENVANLLSGDRGTWFGRVLGHLAANGFDAEWHCIPASAVGAPHGRDRVWIVAYPEQVEWVCPVFNADHATEKIGTVQAKRMQNGLRSEMGTTCRSIPGWWMDQPQPVGVANGVSDWPHRLAACGNAVVPQIPELIGRAIVAACPEIFNPVEAI
jgi:DNA (cytosine-5)-methyltransferase 1